MGAWGPGVFSSDLACEVREAFTDAIRDGHSSENAVRLTLEAFAESLDDYDEADEVWIALAAAMSQAGRLTDAVKERALEAIDSGRALTIWEDTEGGKQARKRVLTKLRLVLTENQPPAKRLRKRKLWVAPFEAGDVLRVALDDGRGVLAIVVDVFADNGGRYNALTFLRRDDSSVLKVEEFLENPIGPENDPIRRHFLVGGKTVPASVVRIAQGIRPPDAGLMPPYRIETFDGGWRIDLPGAVTSWQALSYWAAAFLDRRTLEPPYPLLERDFKPSLP